MTREQAINSMISHGFTVEQVGEIIKAVTPQLSSELEKNSKKLEKGTTKNDLGVDCISRKALYSALYERFHDEDASNITDVKLGAVRDFVKNFPSVTPQLSVPEVTALAEWIEKLTKECEEAYNKGYEAGRKELEPITSKDKFIYALTACGCLLKDGKTWYEHNELIKCFEDLGLFEQETKNCSDCETVQACVEAGIRSTSRALDILDRIRAEIENEWPLKKSPFGSYSCGLRRAIEIIDKYKAESEDNK